LALHGASLQWLIISGEMDHWKGGRSGAYCRTGSLKEQTYLVEMFELTENDNLKSKYKYIQEEILKGKRINLSLSMS
jgi:hypothetical protein